MLRKVIQGVLVRQGFHYMPRQVDILVFQIEISDSICFARISRGQGGPDVPGVPLYAAPGGNPGVPDDWCPEISDSIMLRGNLELVFLSSYLIQT